MDEEDEELLDPVGGLHEVVALELGDHVPVRVVYPQFSVAVGVSEDCCYEGEGKGGPIQKYSVRYHQVGSWDMMRCRAG